MYYRSALCYILNEILEKTSSAIVSHCNILLLWRESFFIVVLCKGEESRSKKVNNHWPGKIEVHIHSVKCWDACQFCRKLTRRLPSPPSAVTAYSETKTGASFPRCKPSNWCIRLNLQCSKLHLVSISAQQMKWDFMIKSSSVKTLAVTGSYQNVA